MNLLIYILHGNKEIERFRQSLVPIALVLEAKLTERLVVAKKRLRTGVTISRLAFTQR